MTNAELAQSIRHDLFADRSTVKQAWDYAFEVMDRLRDDDKVAAMTAMMVLMNTISNQILDNERKAI
jgi:Fe-S cluster assembly iron-binding protein IscA